MKKKSVIQAVLLVFLLHVPGVQQARAQSNVVRLAVVNTPAESGLLQDILPDFETHTGLRVDLYAGSDAILRARNGQVDLLISHYGHADLESFMTDSLGLWPTPVFANQQAIIGPSSDPAHVANLQDAVEAFRRIGQSKSPYVVNNGAIPKYVEDILWEAAGRPPKEAWYIDLGINADNGAQQAAAQRGAYMIFGLVPFLQFLRQNPVDLRPLVVNDSVLSRTMVSVVVKPEKFPQANTAGATALQKYLVLPSTQARIRAYRIPGLDQALWWTRGIDTSTANLGYEGSPPAVFSGGIVNSANRTAGISPGTIVEIYGANLANDTCTADIVPWPAQLRCSPTRVAVGSRDIPLYYVSPSQINAQIPSDAAPGSVNVTVFRGVVPSSSVTITLGR